MITQIKSKTAYGSFYAHCPYFSSGALARTIEKLANRAWKPLGLSPSQAYVLLLAFSYPGLQPSSVANALLLEPAAVTRLIRRLEKKDLVIRTPYSNIAIIELTPKAFDLFEKILECKRNFQDECSRILGESESTTLIAGMNHATDNIILKMNI